MIKILIFITLVMTSFTGCLNSQESFKYNNQESVQMTLVDGWTNFTKIIIFENNNMYSLFGVYKKNRALYENYFHTSDDYFKIKGIRGKIIKIHYRSIEDAKNSNRVRYESMVEFNQAIQSVEIYKKGKFVATISDEGISLDPPLITVKNVGDKGIEWSVDGNVDSVAVYSLPFDGKGQLQALDFTTYGTKIEKFTSTIKSNKNIGVIYFIATRKLKFYISYYVPSRGFILNFLNLEKREN